MEEEKSEYRNTLHMVNVDGSGQMQLLDDSLSLTDPQWSPCGEKISFLSGKNGKTNIWLMSNDCNDLEMVTNVATGVSSYKWSPDGKWIAYTAMDAPTEEDEKAQKEKNDSYRVGDKVRNHRLYLISIEKDGSGKRENQLLVQENFNIGIPGYPGLYDWSPDGAKIVVTHTATPDERDFKTSSISLFNVSGHTLTPLVNQETVAFEAVFSPDGERICFCVSDVPVFGCDYCLYVLELSTNKLTALAETSDYRPCIVNWSSDSKGIYYREHCGTCTQLHYLPINGVPEVISPKDGVMNSETMDKVHKYIAFVYQTVSSPPEIFVSSIDIYKPHQITQINKTIDDIAVPKTEVIKCKSKDGLLIECLLTYPDNYRDGNSYPLVVSIHGGPPGVFSESFIGAPSIYGPIAVFASQGYVVLRCNVRGSTGYGRDFRHANYQDWGGKDFSDILACIESLVEEGIADQRRVGLVGWSYGGYLTASAITQSNMFKAAVIGAGITNLISNAGTCDIPDDIPNHFGGQVWDKVDLLIKKSPVLNVEKTKTPTLILHGEWDARVPIGQGYEFYNALKRTGCKVEMVVYPRTGHVPHEPKHLKNVMDRMVEWFNIFVRTSY